ncbi:MAG: hypothetical protein O7D32_00335 [bacterium]|nr:hypothetical protein [bacterium]
MDNIHPELEELFERYRKAPEGFSFVPLADACRKMGSLDEALEICEKGIARHPTYVSGYVVRGKCFYDKGDLEMAMGTFEKVLDLDANNLVALKFLGMMEAEGGDFKLARIHLEQILVLDPNNKDVNKTVRMIDEEIEGQRASEESTESSAKKAEDDEPDDDDASVALGAMTDDDLDSGPSEPPSTAAPILTSDDIETSDELATITLAEIFASQGYIEKARTIYEGIQKRNPDNELVKERLSELPGEFEEPIDEETADTATPEKEDDVDNETVRFSELDSERSVDPGKVPGEKGHPVGVTVKSARKRRRERGGPTIDDKDSMERFRRWLGEMGG